MTKPEKITFARWALMQAGNISAIHHGRASLRIEAGQFVMRGREGVTHVLNVAQTTAERLDAHWRQFATVNA